MITITKEQKVQFLQSYVRTIIGMTADFDFETEDHDLFLSEVGEYLAARAILIDYAPELESEFSEDLSKEIEKWNDELATILKNG